jgi:hypothetical protein
MNPVPQSGNNIYEVEILLEERINLLPVTCNIWVLALGTPIVVISVSSNF